MQNYIFTFGLGHAYERTAVKIEASNWQSARDCMIKNFGLDFSTQYLENDYYKSYKESSITLYPILQTLTAD